MSRTRIIGAMVVVILALVFLWPSDREAAVRGQLESLRQSAEVDRRLTLFEAGEQSAGVLKHFDESVTFSMELEDVDRVEIVGKEELKKRLIQAYTQLNSLEVAFRNISLEFSADKAVARLDASVLGAMPGNEGQFLEMHRIEITLRTSSGNPLQSSWLVHSVQHLENLRESTS